MGFPFTNLNKKIIPNKSIILDSTTNEKNHFAIEEAKVKSKGLLFDLKNSISYFHFILKFFLVGLDVFLRDADEENEENNEICEIYNDVGRFMKNNNIEYVNSIV